MLKLLCVADLAQFQAEVLPPQTVRLELTFQTRGNGPALVRVYTLRLQGWQREELVQLTEDVRIALAPNDHEPWDTRDRTRQAALEPWQGLVKTYLERQGYAVRGGFYAIPDDLPGLAGHFECARWERTGEEWTVAAAEHTPDPEPDALTAARHLVAVATADQRRALAQALREVEP